MEFFLAANAKCNLVSVFGIRFFNIGLLVIWVGRTIYISLLHPALLLSCAGAASAVH
jgi:hypothetical protein